MAYSVPTEGLTGERLRHRYLSEMADPGTRRQFDTVGVAAGWRCLEVGAGAGSVARMLAEQVGADGEVLATDIDLRLLDPAVEVPAQLHYRRHDIVEDPLACDHFDLAHARGVLEHIEQRGRALERMIEAVRPGGWVIVEDGNWDTFFHQPIPEPFANLVRIAMEYGRRHAGMDPGWGLKIPSLMHSLGLADIDIDGEVRSMRGATASLEWYVLALEWAAPAMIDAGAIDAATVRAALEQARDPSFVLISHTRLAVRGRKPTR